MMNNNIPQFLSDTIWSDATKAEFDADWSVRCYARLTHDNGDTAILLISPPDDHPDSLIGHKIGEWSRMNAHFKSIGVNVPTIIKQDLNAGLIVMEDFGDETILDKGEDAYLKATDILINMRDNPHALSTDLIKYEDTHVYNALRFYPQYVSGGDVDAWFKAWKNIENTLPSCPRALTHIDFGHMNIMWNDGDLGVIDFQAACDGLFVYDMVNLLEDIRIDVGDGIKQSCKDHYCALLSPEDKAIFDQWYLVITAQFYARVLGQIQFLSQTQGRNDLIQYYEPLTVRFKNVINHKTLKPIRDFINRHCEGTK